ncbi:MAG: AAA family ATPase [Chloroflexi bacterium]|nr:AAA family ATPase [Chloroflexota bacterium]
MTFTLAVAGKGGTGKTSIAAMLITWLARERRGSILAIDADPASNLHLALGLPLPMTVGQIREDLGKQNSPDGLNGMTRVDYLDHKVRMSIEEGVAMDLLVMGRPEGAGCYCAVNHLLRQIVDRVGQAYAYVVIDNEAGMEHLSRRTTRDVDLLLLATDPTMRGLKTAEAMIHLARDLDIRVGTAAVVVNRVHGCVSPSMQSALAALPVDVAGYIPEDERVGELDGAGLPLAALDGNSPAYAAVAGLARSYIPA